MSIRKAYVFPVSYDDEEFRGKAAGDKKIGTLNDFTKQPDQCNMLWSSTKA